MPLNANPKSLVSLTNINRLTVIIEEGVHAELVISEFYLLTRYRVLDVLIEKRREQLA